MFNIRNKVVRIVICAAGLLVSSPWSAQAQWNICIQKEQMYVVVNKKNPLNAGFIPEDLIVPNVPFSFSGVQEKSQLSRPAAKALEDLYSQAKKQQISFKAVSGYRSYQRQGQIFNANVSEKGFIEANRVSAQPGQSEHQTGLAIDISSASVEYDLVEELGDTVEGIWIEKNAYKSGFILRYPKGKESITGYMYEPWHIRYVGVELATYLYVNDLTLEDVYNCSVINNTTKRPVCLKAQAILLR